MTRFTSASFVLALFLVACGGPPAAAGTFEGFETLTAHNPEYARAGIATDAPEMNRVSLTVADEGAESTVTVTFSGITCTGRGTRVASDAHPGMAQVEVVSAHCQDSHQCAMTADSVRVISGSGQASVDLVGGHADDPHSSSCDMYSLSPFTLTPIPDQWLTGH